MTPRRRRLVVPVVWCALMSLGAQEPTDMWKLQNVADTADGRVEGFDFDRQVGEGSISLVAFFAYRDPIDFARADRLTIEFFSWQPRHARVVARETTPVHGYYMEHHTEARMGANQWPDWPTDKLRHPQKRVSADRLGVVVRLGADRTETARADGQVAPAILRQPGSTPLRAISEYSATFLADRNIDGLSYEVLEGCGDGIRGKPVATDSYGPVYEGNSLTFSFRAGRPGLATLRVSYKARGVDYPKLTYCFWHVPDLSDPAQLNRIPQ
jgi:hypothetical protein